MYFYSKWDKFKYWFKFWYVLILTLYSIGISYLYFDKLNSEHPLIYITRYEQHNDTISGKLRFHYKYNPICYEVIENTDYIIPDGIYEVQLTHSPKFNKEMPIIVNVPGRAGIRIHYGSCPEHSKGCVLVDEYTLNKIIKFIETNRKNERKTYVYINTVNLIDHRNEK